MQSQWFHSSQCRWQSIGLSKDRGREREIGTHQDRNDVNRGLLIFFRCPARFDVREFYDILTNRGIVSHFHRIREILHPWIYRMRRRICSGILRISALMPEAVRLYKGIAEDCGLRYTSYRPKHISVIRLQWKC